MADKTTVPRHHRYSPHRHRHWLRVVTFGAVATLGSVVAWGGEPTPGVAAAAHASTPPGPRVIGQLPTMVRYRLERAYPIAVGRVREVASCRELFAGLGADGLQKLTRTIYLPPQPGEWRTCQGRVSAFTGVGQPHTRLCPAFADLSTDYAVIILLHEALHFSGFDERPHDPNGLTPLQINRMVESACGL